MYWCMSNVKFGMWLQSAAEERGITLADVAKRGGVSSATIWRIANGEDAITVCHYAGHTDVRVTLRYVYQTDDDIRKAHARSSPVDNWL